MNLIICLSVLFVFVTVFLSLLISFEILYPDISEHPFFSSDIPEKTVFLMGSSHVGMLNASHIQENLQENGLNYEVYNIATIADKPSKRMQNLPEIISLKPKLVVYGIGYRDFTQNIIYEKNPPLETILPNPKQMFDDFIFENSGKFNEVNPKLLTLKASTRLYGKIFPSEDSEKTLINLPKTPFFSYDDSHFTILNSTELQKNPAGNDPIKNIDPSSDNREILYLKKIISDLQENDIQLVIFKTPLHRYYLNNVSSSEKENFNIIVEKIEDEFSLTIYDFSELADLTIWSDFDHIAINQNSTIYSDNIAKIILLEINS